MDARHLIETAISAGDEPKPDYRNASYRSLELLCRKQAALSSTSSVRRELEVMAREYAALADRLEHQAQSEPLGDV